MRILMTTDTVGGVWNFTATLCEVLCGEREVSLVSFGRAPSAGQARWVHDMERLHGTSFSFHASDVPLEWMADNQRAYTGGAGLLADIAERFQPDVFHANQFCWGALPREAALRVPRVVTAHSDVLSWASACRPDGLQRSAWLDRYVQLVQSGLDGADAVAAPTMWMLEALRANFPLPDGGHVLPNGVTLPPGLATSRPGLAASRPGSAQRLEAPAAERRLQAVSAGRVWDEAKNLVSLLEVRSPMPIQIAGERHFEQAEALVTTRGDVVLLGALERPEVLRLFASSAVYICPSLYEPFGLAPLEAAMQGCALVLHDIPPLREIWRDAALFYRDRSSLEAHLRELAADAALLAHTARRCAERAAAYSAERMGKAYAALFASLCSNMPVAQREGEVACAA